MPRMKRTMGARGRCPSARQSLLASASFVLAMLPSVMPQTITSDSNWSYQSGEFEYLPAYLLLNTPRLASLTGQVSLTRLRTGSARIEVSLEGQADQSDLSDASLIAKLHRSECLFGGGIVYQDPYLCPAANGGCSPSEVEARAAIGTFVEVNVSTSITFPPSGIATSYLQYQWGVHIPDTDRSSLSIVLYDPDSGARMMCADLASDRVQDGFEVSEVNQGVSRVPVVSEASISRLETGNTVVSISLNNLVAGSSYPVTLIDVPCDLREDIIGADHVVDFDCTDNAGSIDCNSDPEPHLELFPGTGVSASAVRNIPELLTTTARAMIVGFCSSGACPPVGDPPFLACINIHNEFIFEGLSTAAGNTFGTQRPDDTTVPSATNPDNGGPAEQLQTTEISTIEAIGKLSAAPTPAPGDNGQTGNGAGDGANDSNGTDGDDGALGRSSHCIYSQFGQLDYVDGMCCLSTTVETSTSSKSGYIFQEASWANFNLGTLIGNTIQQGTSARIGQSWYTRDSFQEPLSNNIRNPKATNKSTVLPYTFGTIGVILMVLGIVVTSRRNLVSNEETDDDAINEYALPQLVREFAMETADNPLDSESVPLKGHDRNSPSSMIFRTYGSLPTSPEMPE